MGNQAKKEKQPTTRRPPKSTSKGTKNGNENPLLQHNHATATSTDPALLKELTPYMRNMAQTPEEQVQKNKPLIQWLEQQRQRAEALTEEEIKNNQALLNIFKQTLDSLRPSGHKLFSE